MSRVLTGFAVASAVGHKAMSPVPVKSQEDRADDRPGVGLHSTGLRGCGALQGLGF